MLRTRKEERTAILALSDAFSFVVDELYYSGQKLGDQREFRWVPTEYNDTFGTVHVNILGGMSADLGFLTSIIWSVGENPRTNEAGRIALLQHLGEMK